MRGGRRGRGSVTVQDVARAAGVSAMTVSRVVNGGSNVSDATRDAVDAAIRQLNYRPNPAARSLAAGAAAQLGMLYSNPSAAYLSQFLIGTLAGAGHAGCHVVLEPCEGETDADLAEAVRRFTSAKVAGVVLPPPFSESAIVQQALATADIPWVAIAMGRAAPGALNVRIDDFAAAHAMAEHLLALGHRRIGFIRGNTNQTASFERERGFVAALEEAGIAPLAIEQGDFTFRGGLGAAERLLSSADRPSAIFASNDDMAAATIGVAHRMGLDVPHDISVVGFDDTAPATNVWPPLTTIRQPIAEMAEVAVALLVGRMRGGGSEGEEKILTHELVVRESCAEPRD